MTNDGWGKEWPVVKPRSQWDKDVANLDWSKPNFPEAEAMLQQPNPFIGIDFGSEPSKSFIGNRELKPQGSNLVDDEAYLYFQCSSCNNIFDPHTKSFAQLNQRRADAGWKVKWNVDGMGYKVYCVECGEKVE